MRLRESLAGSVPAPYLDLLTDRYDVVGDVAVLSLHPSLQPYEKEIARSVVRNRTTIRTVLNRVSKLEGEHRVARYEAVAGKETVTCHREYGFSYRLDVATVFFNPSLGTERQRVAGMVGPGERVLVPFAGVGPFVVPAAARGARVVAVEKNPEACRWCEENIALNRVEGKVVLVRGDAFDLRALVDGPFDRAIVPTPYGRDDALEQVVPLVRPGGSIHFYTFKTAEEISGLSGIYQEMGLEINAYRRCGNVAPGVSRWVFDLVRR